MIVVNPFLDDLGAVSLHFVPPKFGIARLSRRYGES
jgi:hypothetical protein